MKIFCCISSAGAWPLGYICTPLVFNSSSLETNALWPLSASRFSISLFGGTFVLRCSLLIFDRNSEFIKERAAAAQRGKHGCWDMFIIINAVRCCSNNCIKCFRKNILCVQSGDIMTVTYMVRCFVGVST